MSHDAARTTVFRTALLPPLVVAAALGSALVVPEASRAQPLEPVLAYTETDLAGSSGVAVSPDGAHVYVANGGANRLLVWSRSAATGALARGQTLTDDESGGSVATLEGVRGLVLSPDGAHLYAISGSDAAVTAFARNPASGDLTAIDAELDGAPGTSTLLDLPADIAIGPDGDQVFVAGSVALGFAVFDRDAGSGELTFAYDVPWAFNQNFLINPTAVAVSPDGDFLYVASDNERVLSTYRRLPDGGVALIDAEGPFNVGDALSGVLDVTVSPDSAHVYTANALAPARNLAAFTRAPGPTDEGTLEPSDVVAVAGTGPGPSRLVVHPSGAFVFANDVDDEQIVVFGRDGATGDLTFLDDEDASELGGGIQGPPTGLAASPEGAHLYVTAANQLLVFRVPEPAGARLAATAALAVLAQRRRHGAARA